MMSRHQTGWSKLLRRARGTHESQDFPMKKRFPSWPVADLMNYAKAKERLRVRGGAVRRLGGRGLLDGFKEKRAGTRLWDFRATEIEETSHG